MKLAAARLDALPLLGRDFLRAQVAIEQSLHAALSRRRRRSTCARPGPTSCKRARLIQHHPISREQLTRARAHEHRAARAAGPALREFEDLFDVERGPPVLVVTFIALLELAREHLIEVTQAEAFAPIYVRLGVPGDAEARRPGPSRSAEQRERAHFFASLKAIIARSLFGSTGLISRWKSCSSASLSWPVMLLPVTTIAGSACAEALAQRGRSRRRRSRRARAGSRR